MRYMTINAKGFYRIDLKRCVRAFLDLWRVIGCIIEMGVVFVTRIGSQSRKPLAHHLWWPRCRSSVREFDVSHCYQAQYTNVWSTRCPYTTHPTIITAICLFPLALSDAYVFLQIEYHQSSYLIPCTETREPKFYTFKRDTKLILEIVSFMNNKEEY